MRWLVDGYNVMRPGADGGATEEDGPARARVGVLRLVSRAAERTGDQFTVVFDGAPRHHAAPPGGRVELVFSRAPETADDVLIELARRLGNGAIVVSSDRTVQQGARRAGATAISSEAFVAALEAPVAGVRDEAEEDGDLGGDKRGNPRRISKEARAMERALRRLGVRRAERP